jgi:transposase InsO family protein
MTAAAITGGPPPDDGFLRRIERMMRDGRLPDPRTYKGVVAYAVLGIGIGWIVGG